MKYILMAMMFAGCQTSLVNKLKSDNARLENKNAELMLEVEDVFTELADCRSSNVSLEFNNCEDAKMMVMRAKDHYKRGLVTISDVNAVVAKYKELCY